MKTIDDLIEKYEKNIIYLLDENVFLSSNYETVHKNIGSIKTLKSVISDLKDYKKEIYNKPATLEAIKTEPNYPTLRERLICDLVPYLIDIYKSSKSYKGAVKRTILLADEIINQLKNENNDNA